MKISIEKTKQSKIHHVNFSNVGFGDVFTDHMFVCDYKDGSWQNPRIEPYRNIELDPSAKIFHYGQAFFEGLKAYKDDGGKVWLFRPDQNAQRMTKSAQRLCMPQFPEDLFLEGLKKLVALESDWVKQGEENALYLRPFMFASEPGVRAVPSKAYQFITICSPSQSYYSGTLSLQIADYYTRASNGGYGYAKAGGNYAGQFYPSLLAQEKGFQQVLWTDSKTHEYVEEAGTMNVFVRIKDTLLTAPVGETILDGVTRKSVIEIAKSKHISVEERPIKVSEIIEAHQKGTLKEIFGSGTAAVITPVSTFGHKNDLYSIASIENSFADMLKKTIIDIQYNKSADTFGWRVAVD